MPHFRGEQPVQHPAFAPGGPASIVPHAEGPFPPDAPRIVYSEEDERALEEFARAQGVSLLPSVSSTELFIRFSCAGVQWVRRGTR